MFDLTALNPPTTVMLLINVIRSRNVQLFTDARRVRYLYAGGFLARSKSKYLFWSSMLTLLKRRLCSLCPSSKHSLVQSGHLTVSAIPVCVVRMQIAL